MTDDRRTRFRLLPLCALALATAVPAAADPPILVDRTLGEAEQIRAREAWFYGPRRAGTGSAADMQRLRQAAVEETRRAIAREASRAAAGLVDQANFWVAMGPAPSTFGGWAFGNVSGRVPALAADWASGTIYAGSASGGLWRSTNDGLSWTPLFDAAGTLTIGAVAVDPNDPNVLWAGTGENTQGCEGYFGIGLLRSGDGGATWEPRNGAPGADLEDLSSFASIVVDPRDSNHIVTGGRIRGCSGGSSQAGGIYTTTDGGATWTRRLGPAQVYEIAQDPQVRDVFWAATSAGIYRSQDNGVTWIQQTASGLPSGSTGRTELAIAPTDSNVVYALFASGNSGSAEFWRTTDGGASWTEMSSGSNACDGQCWYNMTLAVHQTDPNTVFRGTVHIFKSTDGGANWTDLSNSWGSSQKVHQDTHFLLMDPNAPGTFWVGCDGGVWKSVDGGASFLERNGDLNLTQFYAVGVHPTDSGIICGGAQDNSSLARTASNVWDLQAVTGDGFVCWIDPQIPDYAYIASYPSGGYPNVSRSETGVLGSFHGITGPGSGINEGDRINWVTPYLLDPTRPNILFLGTHRIYRSTDRGSTWVPVGPDDLTNGSGNVVSLDINRNFPDVLLAGTTDGKVWRTTDGGFTWTDISAGLPARSINDVASDPVDPRRALAVVSGFGTAHLWEWREGLGWSPAGTGLPDVPANSVVMLTGDELYVGCDTGVFRSSDGGASLTPAMNGLPEGLVVTDLHYDQARDLLTAGTYGRGAWQMTVDPIGPILLFDSIEQPLLEVDGDGDGSVEPGETWQVRPLLRNAGNQPALGVTARLATSTPGVTIESPDVRSYGDLSPGAAGPAASGYSFVVDPTFPCGETIVFDLVDIASTDPPAGYTDQLDAFRIAVLDHRDPPIVTTLLDEDFDPPPQTGWTHEAQDPGFFFCHLPYLDEWHIAQKDAAHGQSYHCGNGPGSSYGRSNDAWLYYGGRDSLGGPGLVIPADARTATMTLVHWYDTDPGFDGGQVAIDADEDGLDQYQTLEPTGGYPPGTLAANRCNGLENNPAFHGSSGGWITSTFDLSPYRGRRVYLAFIFGSDSTPGPQEGWYIDKVHVEWEKPGPPLCDTTRWPGEVPPTALFTRGAGGTIDVTWDDACNAAAVPGQTYSIQAGDLARLATGGGFSHAPVAGRCDRLSPDSFTPGAGSEYYLVVPNGSGRDGSPGPDSGGAERPEPDGTCGLPRAERCP